MENKGIECHVLSCLIVGVLSGACSSSPASDACDTDQECTADPCQSGSSRDDAGACRPNPGDDGTGDTGPGNTGSGDTGPGDDGPGDDGPGDSDDTGDADGTDTDAEVDTDDSPLLAFPGAVGYGKDTIGGRGGQVIHVTSLDDSGPGTLREALATEGPRTIIFRVSGTIALDSTIRIEHSNVTIAGQSAPGGDRPAPQRGLGLRHAADRRHRFGGHRPPPSPSTRTQCRGRVLW